MAVRPPWDLRQATLAVLTGGGTCQSSSLPISTSVGWGRGVPPCICPVVRGLMLAKLPPTKFSFQLTPPQPRKQKDGQMCPHVEMPLKQPSPPPRVQGPTPTESSPSQKESSMEL